MTMTVTATPATTTNYRPAASLPACPTWCAGDCVGGEIERHGNGVTIPADRLHELTLIDETVVDGDSYRGTRSLNLRLIVERYDTVDPDEPPTETRAVFVVDSRQRLAPTSAQLRELAYRALEAADLLDAATPALRVAA